MLLRIMFSLVMVGAVLQLSEIFWDHKIIRGEALRKLVHVLVGSFVASWPWLMNWQYIRLISVAFLLTVIINRRYKIFHALHTVKRKSYGDICFALGIGASALLTSSKVYFSIAIISLALADAVAALVGEKYGTNWAYKVFGQKKTVIGSMAFWISIMWILGIGLALGSIASPYSNYILALILIPPVATLAENIFPYGLDNLAVPLTLVGMLTLLQ